MKISITTVLTGRRRRPPNHHHQKSRRKSFRAYGSIEVQDRMQVVIDELCGGDLCRSCKWNWKEIEEADALLLWEKCNFLDQIYIGTTRRESIQERRKTAHGSKAQSVYDEFFLPWPNELITPNCFHNCNLFLLYTRASNFGGMSGKMGLLRVPMLRQKLTRIKLCMLSESLPSSW